MTVAEGFNDSLAALDESAETVEAFKQLMLRVAAEPELGRPLPGEGIRVMKTRGYGPFLPLRVFYWVDDETIYLLDVDVIP